MKLIRIAAIPAAAVLLTVPVLTPVWADPHPVTPTVHRQPLKGVDQTALVSDPPAFDPASADGAITSSAPRATASQRPAVLTSQLETGRFSAAGVVWTGSTSPRTLVVQVRIREQGHWSDWQSLDSEDGADPGSVDAAHARGRHATAPISSATADAIQVRVDAVGGKIPADVQLMTVDPGTSPADANLAASPSATAHGDIVAPAIISRAQWGADESLRDCSPTYSRTLKVGVVHHTVNSNSYAPSDSAALVRGIYAFHVNGNGWCDIGYNFLVDRYGQTFEGRAGGADRPVIGAHAGGFNTDSFGVSAIGTFDTASPPAVMVTAISRVLGWKLGLHGRDPLGSTTLTSAGGPYTNYPPGTVVPLGVVSGHRNVDATGCPGDLLYAQLPTIRAQAASYAAANSFRSEDLYGLLSGSTGSGDVEVHAQTANTVYSQRLIDAATQIATGDPSQWRFFVGSSMGDTRPDLIAVRTAGGASGRVELHVVSWASYYRDTVLDVATPVGSFTADSTTQLAVGGPGGGNLYFVSLGATGSGTVEVHGLSSSSNYTSWLIHSPTALRTGYASTTSRFLVAQGSGDLYLVLHGSTGSGRTEVHAVSAASGYQTFTMHAATPVGPTSDRTATWALGTAAVPDVFYIPLAATGSNAVELHRLSPSTAYSTWTLHAATSLPLASYPTWQFGLG